jgi:hypothetical protein
MEAGTSEGEIGECGQAVDSALNSFLSMELERRWDQHQEDSTKQAGTHPFQASDRS